MSWWGKVIGGAFGFMLGGPLGAALGAALGHNFDRGIDHVQRLGGGVGAGFGHAGGAGPGGVERIQSAFFSATFSVMGYVAKCDGRVSPDEISLARQVMAQMRLNEAQKRVAIRLFEEGKQPDFPLDAALLQLRQECGLRRNLLQMFLEIQIATALADGDLRGEERRVLMQVTQRLGFPAAFFDGLLGRMQAQRHFHSQPSPAQALADAYRMLGVAEGASFDEVKKAYRRQMNQHHPDKLVAKGLPEEMMAIAQQKAQDIGRAYELIKKARGL